MNHDENWWHQLKFNDEVIKNFKKQEITNKNFRFDTVCLWIGLILTAIINLIITFARVK